MSTKNKIILISVITLAGAALLIVLLIYPIKNKVLQTKQEITAKQSSFSQQQSEVKNILETNQTYKITDISKINTIFLSRGDALYLINTLEAAAQKNNCTLVISLSDPADSNYTELISQLSLQGEFNDVVNFINEIEEQNFYLNYETFFLSSKAGLASTITEAKTVNGQQITASISVKTFWQ